MATDGEMFSPGTPPPSLGVGETVKQSNEEQLALATSEQAMKGKKRHRRAKGKKKKQKSHLLITNEDGTHFNQHQVAASVHQQKRSTVNLRPTNNPLINAPKNSTQFIIDDHEDSNLFWKFDAPPPSSPPVEQDGGIAAAVRGGRPSEAAGGGLRASGLGERVSPDDENFWAEYSERDFESVYETAHQEEVYSWEKDKIIREIAAMEKKHKHLIEMLAAIDPAIYLQKLQHELLSLQEVNRQLKLTNIAERLHRQEREKSEGRSRQPDSTSKGDTAHQFEEDEVEDSEEEDEEEDMDEEEEDNKGGCSSGCCLAASCQEGNQRLKELDEEVEEQQQHISDSRMYINKEVAQAPQACTSKTLAVTSDTGTSAGTAETSPSASKASAGTCDTSAGGNKTSTGTAGTETGSSKSQACATTEPYSGANADCLEDRRSGTIELQAGVTEPESHFDAIDPQSVVDQSHLSTVEPPVSSEPQQGASEP